jgi:quercetin dioxygenase-like cupin family protein
MRESPEHLMTNRREFLSAAAAQSAVSASGRKSPIANKAVSLEDTRASEFPQGAARTYLNGPTDQLKDLATGTWRIKPGRSPHDVHQHPEEELLIFTEGTGEIVIAGVRQPVKPGSVMYCAANVPHGVFNGPDSEMLFYFVKWRA